ncbi:MAG: ATP-binding cassette domain-containing protein [Promethearchaeota archaeon]
MSENIIEVKNLTKTYKEGNVLAVDDISFSIRKGEVFALLGPNGAGKTTTISILSTILHPTRGEIKVNSYDVLKEPDKVRKSIGIVFQESAVDSEMTGWENLELHAILYGIPKKERRKKIKEVLKLVDLEDKADLYVKNYSGGMKRRLEIARGLIHEPKILFLDEPTLGLDPQTRRKIWEKIKELNQGISHMTILITTHYMEEADELADRICIMDKGKIIAMDTSENLKKQISGNIVEIEFEKIKNHGVLPEIISQLKKIEGIKNVSLMDSAASTDFMQMNINLPPGMKNVNPQMIRARMQEIMSDPKKLIKAWKKFPMSSQMFLNAPLEAKKRIAHLFTPDLIEQIPEPIRETILKIQKGEYSEETSSTFEPKISISCENGSRQLPPLILKINDLHLQIKNINMHQPTLEDVFLHYTGSAIREETSNHTKEIKKFIQMRKLRK